MFRLDIELGDRDGGIQRKFTYVWLCSRCASALTPKVQVSEGTVKLLLATKPKDMLAAHPGLVN